MHVWIGDGVLVEPLLNESVIAPVKTQDYYLRTMGVRGKPEKIVPMLNEILERLKAHNTITIHFARSSFKTTKGIDELKVSVDKKHDVLMKEFKELRVLKEEGYRTLDAAEKWTPLKAYNVSSNYFTAIGMLGGNYLMSVLDKEFQIQQNLREAGKKLVTRNPDEALALADLYWPF